MNDRLVGVTGGIGAGKSSVLECLKTFPCQTLDCDIVVHQLYEIPCSPLVRKLHERWGNAIDDTGGGVSRAKIARRVFSNPDELRWLNEQIHPLVWNKIREIAATLGKNELLFCGVPLLFEAEWERRFDVTVSVWCDQHTQFERLHSRGWTRKQIEQRLSFQMSMTEKLQRADVGIINNSSRQVLREQVTRIATQLLIKTHKLSSTE